MHRSTKLYLDLAEKNPALSSTYLEMAEEDRILRSKFAKDLNKLRQVCERDEAYTLLANAYLVGNKTLEIKRLDDVDMYTFLDVLWSAMTRDWRDEWLRFWKNTQTINADYALKRLEELGEIEIDYSCPDCHGSGGAGHDDCWLCQGKGVVRW